MHKIQVDIISAQILQALLQSVRSARLVRIIQLGSEPDIRPSHARRLDARADFLLVLVGGGGVDVAIAMAEGGFNRGLDLVGLGLPCSQADGGDFGARVESMCSTAESVSG